MSAALITLTVLPISAVVALPAPEANAFCSRYSLPFHLTYCPHEGHDAITHDALKFLSPGLARQVVQGNVDQDAGDTGGRPELHFSNCLFEESTAYIQSQYQKIIDAIVPATTVTPDTAIATTWWGQLLHTVQDFYSHSSWVDPEPVGLGFGTTHGKYLLDAGLVNWRSIRSYAPLFGGSGPFSDIVAVEGNPPVGVIGLPRDPNGHPNSVVPTWTRTSADLLRTWTEQPDPSIFKTYRGLMTAVSEPLNTVEQKCPPANRTDCLDEASTCIRHGGGECVSPTGWRPIWFNCFNHDTDERRYHDVAFDTAVVQTRHEWCRLLHMLRDQKGYNAASVPIALWVRNQGNMHPPGTICAERTPERASVTVHYKGRWSHSVAVSTFVAYSGDFRQSFRHTGGPADTMSGTGHICIEPGKAKTIAATMWGYDKTRNGSAADAVAGLVGMVVDDRVRIGTTVELHGPNYPKDVQYATSGDVRLEVSVTRDTHPAANCGRTEGGGSGGGGGGGGGGGSSDPGGGHKQN